MIFTSITKSQEEEEAAISILHFYRLLPFSCSENKFFARFENKKKAENLKSCLLWYSLSFN